MHIPSDFSFTQQIEHLRRICDELKNLISTESQLNYLLSIFPIEKVYLKLPTFYFDTLILKKKYAIISIFIIEQDVHLFSKNPLFSLSDFDYLIDQLVELENFYCDLGGIIGYHLTFLTLIQEQTTSIKTDFSLCHYLHPEGISLVEDESQVKKMTRIGLENLPHTIEVYPVGGAGDRLDLRDELTNAPLPVALLPFLGRSLLSGLMRDLQAREYLYFKLFNKQIITPVVLMTSSEKENDKYIRFICNQRAWFGRKQQHFYFVNQPLVPVITLEGHWVKESFNCLKRKPGGHGAIWKLMNENGLIKLFKQQQKHQCAVRQINNPIGGCDHSILTLIGMGSAKNKSFGFLSCERPLRCEEGANVIVQKKINDAFSYCLTNIEYTDFKKYGIDDRSSETNSNISIFPTNTNILYANLHAIEKALECDPLPGKLINCKSAIDVIDANGQVKSILAGRVESTMQNIADYFITYTQKILNQEELKQELETFIIYNERYKTISTTKKSYTPNTSPLGTPELAFYDLLHNHYQLLKACHFALPQWKNFKDYLSDGPSCLFLFHPALGPLYSLVRQKIKNGILHPGAELNLEIAEIDIDHLEVEGSLLVECISPLGYWDDDYFLHFGNESRCTLKNVKIINKGINFAASHPFWKNRLNRRESVRIVLNAHSEFVAENITITGNHLFEVPANHRLTLIKDQNQWIEQIEPIQNPTWTWKYAFDEQDEIVLTKTFLDNAR